MNTAPTSDEKVTAALVHGSIFLVFLGPIVPIIIWASQRKKSKFVSFHALQTMGYQALIFWLWVVAIILIVVLAIFLILPLSVFITKNSHNAGFAPFIFQIFIFASIFGLMGIAFLTGITGAIYCLIGRDFRYPLLGKWLENYLSYDPSSEAPMDETHEENWVAGICHATTILRLWGILTPLLVWFTQKERSIRLRFQSMQALVYQGIALMAYLIGMILYMVSFFGMFFILLSAGMMSGNKEIQGLGAVIVLIFIGMMVLFWFIVMIILPIYYLLAGFASIRTIQGHQFRYPILGKIVEARMKKAQRLESMS
jgi:uncharacterized Tic20 family protein